MVLVMILDAPTELNGNIGMGLLQANDSKRGMESLKIYHYFFVCFPAAWGWARTQLNRAKQRLSNGAAAVGYEE